MLWIFVLALIMPISLGSCDDTNLAHVTWAHAVNSHAELTAALDNDNIQMIEADVIIGKLKVTAPEPAPAPEAATAAPPASAPVPPEPGSAPVPPAPPASPASPASPAPATENEPKTAVDEDKKDDKPAVAAETPAVQTPIAQAPADPAQGAPADTNVPIMGHPPDTESDLSLAQFLDAVATHNNDTQKPKGVKLDFKSIEALKQSKNTFKSKDLKADLWINADIIAGPGKKAGKEVNAKEFFDAIHANEDLVNKTLSIGWTTELDKDKKVSYEKNHIEDMTKAIEDSKIPVGYPITFPVRAAIAAESKETLRNLYDAVSKERKVTFTIWSGADDTDKVDVDKLQEFINSFGVDKVYVDVPEDLGKKINLTGGASATVKFGLFNLAAIVIAMFFSNGFH